MTDLPHTRQPAGEELRIEQLRLLAEVSRRITSILDVDTLLDQIARLIQETFDYYLVEFGLIEGDQVVIRAGAGPDWIFHSETIRLRLGKEGITGFVAGAGSPILLEDVDQDPRYIRLPHIKSRSMVAVPIRSKGHPLGVLTVESDRLAAFDQGDLVMLTSLADQVAVALENAELYDRAQHLAAVEERQRLAHELHDSVTQSLYGVSMYAEAASRWLQSGNTDRVAGFLDQIRETSLDALREMRLLIFDLRPVLLTELGLAAALKARVEAVESRAGIEVEVEVSGDPSLPAPVEEELFGIAREALNNSLRHGRPRRVRILLRGDPEGVRMEIQDDGQGFDPGGRLGSGGLGLPGMHERAARAHGKLSIDTAPGQGTRVRVEVAR
jgi:signal transduction histidine kinase